MKMDFLSAGLGLLRILTHAVEQDHGIEQGKVWEQIQPIASSALNEFGVGTRDVPDIVGTGYNLAKVIGEARQRKLTNEMERVRRLNNNTSDRRGVLGKSD